MDIIFNFLGLVSNWFSDFFEFVNQPLSNFSDVFNLVGLGQTTLLTFMVGGALSIYVVYLLISWIIDILP